MLFNTNCVENAIIAFFSFFCFLNNLFLSILNPFSQTRYSDIPIIRYNTIQTGPNTKLGGLNDGFTKVLYQVGIDETVKNDPIMPANWHTTIDITNLR